MEILADLPKHQNDNLSKHWVPLYGGEIACGLFGISEDFVDSYLSLDEKFIKHQEATFFIRAGGNSMEPNIQAGDILIVDRSVNLRSGIVGAFFYNGSPICKQFIKQNDKAILRSFNKAYKDVIITENDDLQLFGVVIGLARELY